MPRAPGGDPAPLEATITRVGSPEIVESVWREVESRAARHFFFSWTWIGSWLRLVIPATRVWLFECRREGTTVGVALLTLCRVRRVRGRMPTWQLHVNEYQGDGYNMTMAYNGLLTDPDSEAEVWAAFIAAAEDWLEPWDEISLSSLTARAVSQVGQARGDLRIRPEKAFVRWSLDIDPECARTEHLLGRLKRKKSRQQIRQSLQAYARLGELKLDVATSLGEAHRRFDRLEALHTARWTAVGEEGSFHNPTWVAFHRDIIDQGFANDQIRLIEVTCAGRPIGVLYGHEYGGALYMHQTGFAITSDNALRPGYVCHFEAIRHFAAKGVRLYDLLPDPRDSYKRFFADPGEPVRWMQLQHPRLRFSIERLLRSFRQNGGPHPEA